MSFMTKSADGSLRCAIKVIPGASKTIIQGIRGEELVVKVAAAPEKGKANAELIAFFAKSAACPKSSIRLLSGEHAPHKVLELPARALAFFVAIGGTI
jgi:uncharacterized protein (TIGR00251 family)